MKIRNSIAAGVTALAVFGGIVATGGAAEAATTVPAAANLHVTSAASDPWLDYWSSGVYTSSLVAGTVLGATLAQYKRDGYEIVSSGVNQWTSSGTTYFQAWIEFYS